jgi:hypothetical protein
LGAPRAIQPSELDRHNPGYFVPVVEYEARDDEQILVT